MNKTAIQKFAVEAHKALVRGVEQRAYNYGVTAESCGDPDAATANGRVLTDRERSQRRDLVEAVQAKGYAEVMEEAAYTWFNRFIALRYMELNDYLPTHVRVFSNAAGAFEPEILREALHLDLPGLDRQRVAGYIEQNETGDLYRYLLLTQCNALGEALPQLFERISSYTELLCPDNLLRPDSVLANMVNTIPEADWADQVQIIGWMYQYYNTEVKAETFDLLKKNVKVSKERIPAATQLFTPEWIVRYMVENSLGRLFLEEGGQLPAGGDESARPEAERRAAAELGWRYYLPEAEQPPEVRAALAGRQAGPLDVTALKVLDPCMGSGHILVYAFDVLLQIYEKLGWNRRDAVASIVQNNLYGLEIDKRAAQLAYFAVMMKARQYDRRFLTRGIQPHLLDIPETGSLTTQPMHDMGIGLAPEEYSAAAKGAVELLDIFRDGKEYGSLLRVRPMDWTLLRRFAAALRQDGQITMGEVHLQQASAQLLALVDAAELLAQQYDVVVTNPPYMGSSNMDAKLAAFVKKNHPDAKGDLFACFIERCGQMTKPGRFNCLVTMQSWMFLSSFEKLRNELLTHQTISCLMHMENMVMRIAFGTAVTVFRNAYIAGYRGTYHQIKLQDIVNDAPREFPVPGNRFATVDAQNFTKIPGAPMAYWVSENTIVAYYKSPKISDFGTTRQGLATGENDRFMRNWFEPNYLKVACPPNKYIGNEAMKWYPYHKGGAYRKWYGNNDYVVNWENSGFEIKNFKDSNGKLRSRPQNLDYAFKECITWSLTNSSSFGARYRPDGFMFDINGMSLFIEKTLIGYSLAYLCSIVATYFMTINNPTMASQAGDVARLPFIVDEGKRQKVNALTRQNIDFEKNDWDSYEISWDFKKNPLI